MHYNKFELNVYSIYFDKIHYETVYNWDDKYRHYEYCMQKISSLM